MSQWTHVAAIFRLDSIGKISDEDIYKVFGKEITWNDLYNYDESDDTKTLPMGSEGTLEMSIWHNPDKSFYGFYNSICLWRFKRLWWK